MKLSHFIKNGIIFGQVCHCILGSRPTTAGQSILPYLLLPSNPSCPILSALLHRIQAQRQVKSRLVFGHTRVGEILGELLVFVLSQANLTDTVVGIINREFLSDRISFTVYLYLRIPLYLLYPLRFLTAFSYQELRDSLE